MISKVVGILLLVRTWSQKRRWEEAEALVAVATLWSKPLQGMLLCSDTSTLTSPPLSIASCCLGSWSKNWPMWIGASTVEWSIRFDMRWRLWTVLVVEVEVVATKTAMSPTPTRGVCTVLRYLDEYCTAPISFRMGTTWGVRYVLDGMGPWYK